MNRILCLCTLLLGVTVQQQSLRILINSRIRNTINMSCIITGHPRVTNEEIIFHLNGTSVSEIQDLRPVTREDRGGTINIVVEIGPRSEGNFTCASCSNLDVCSTRSNMVGPIAGTVL